jgi:hypothetical protein
MTLPYLPLGWWEHWYNSSHEELGEDVFVGVDVDAGGDVDASTVDVDVGAGAGANEQSWNHY